MRRAQKYLTLQMAVISIAVCIGSGCHKTGTRDWDAELKGLETKYAPDRRLAVFHVTARTESGRLVLEGEVDSPAARKEALDRASVVSGKPVVDRILTLPDPELGERNSGIVNVSVGNVRRSPGHEAEMLTQYLLGTTVRILKRNGDWFYIQGADRYLGWIDEDALLQVSQRAADDWNSAALVIFTARAGTLFAQPDESAEPVCDLVTGNLLKSIAARGAWLEAALPDGRSGFVRATAVEFFQSWKKTRQLSAEAVEKTARSFNGVPYLWGGTSAKGFDCSGFVKTVYGLNGLELLRDADQQARQGEEVVADPGHLRPGDLLFFGRKAGGGKPEKIWHVAIYLGADNFIHCSGRVRIASIDPKSPAYDRGRAGTLVRARRVIEAGAAVSRQSSPVQTP